MLAGVDKVKGMINVQEKNVFPGACWLNEFPKITYFEHIPQHYQHLITTHKDMSFLKAALHHTVYELPRVFLEQYKILDTVPYYYIKFLMEKNPKTILDLGCGSNVFKPFLHGIVGMDADPDAAADIHDFFDEEYTQGHIHAYDSVISINAIHFSAIDTISKRLIWISKLVRPGGAAFVSFNLETWLMYSNLELIKKLFGDFPKFDDVINYVYDQILATKLHLVVMDWPCLHITEHSTIRDGLNGNIRLVIDL